MMSQEPNWEKMRMMLREELKSSNPIPAKTEDPQKAGSGESHKTLTEMLSCPNCVPDKEAFKHAFHSLMGDKKCKDCGKYEPEDKEYCDHCGEALEG